MEQRAESEYSQEASRLIVNGRRKSEAARVLFHLAAKVPRHKLFRLRRPDLNRAMRRLLLVPLVYLCACHAADTTANSAFRVIAVLDGDTIRVAREGAVIPIRLIGIDAPESSKRDGKPGQPYSRAAKKHLAHLVLQKPVEWVSYGTDDYRRVLGVVHLGGVNVNLEMVRAGLAEAYRGRLQPGFDDSPYRQAEKEARQARRGMWAQGHQYVSPYEWRKTHP